MTDPKSRVQLALEIAALAWHDDEANALAKSIMVGGIHNIATALANVLLHMVDEQATVHPIAGGQLSPNYEAPRYGSAFPGRLAPIGDVPLRVSCPPADAFAEPIATMPSDYEREPDGFSESYVAGLEKERDTLKARVEESRELNQVLQDSRDDWIRSDELVQARIQQLEGELTRVKAENERLSGELADAEGRAEAGKRQCSRIAHEAMAVNTKLTEAEQTIAGLKERLRLRAEQVDQMCRDDLEESAARANRASKLDAVVEAAREAERWIDIDYPGGLDARNALHKALSALDAPGQLEPASEARAIVVGSKWVIGGNMIEVTVSGDKYVGYSLSPGQSVSGAGIYTTHDFASRATHVSDPPAPPGETAEGEHGPR